MSRAGPPEEANDPGARGTREGPGGSPTGRALTAFNLWLVAGFVGASVCGAAVHHAFAGEWPTVFAFAAAVLGALVARACWQRAGRALDHADPARTRAVVVRLPVRDEPSGGAARNTPPPAGPARAPVRRLREHSEY